MRNTTIKVIVTILGILSGSLLLFGSYLVSLPLLMGGSILFVTTTTIAGLHANRK